MNGPHQQPGPGFVDGASAEQLYAPRLAGSSFLRGMADAKYQSMHPGPPRPVIHNDLVSPQITPLPDPVAFDAIAAGSAGSTLPGRVAVLDTSGEPGPNAAGNMHSRGKGQTGP